MSVIPSNHVVQRNPDVVFGNVDGEVMILDVESGNYFHLNATATRVFELLENPLTPEQLCTHLLEEYDVDPETCRGEVFEVLSDFQARGLLKSGD